MSPDVAFDAVLVEAVELPAVVVPAVELLLDVPVLEPALVPLASIFQ